MSILGIARGLQQFFGSSNLRRTSEEARSSLEAHSHWLHRVKYSIIITLSFELSRET
jgi:hypothetical protein